MALMKKALGFTIIMVLSTPLAFAQQALSSWNDTALKQQIVTFIANTVDKSNEQYRPPEQRIAVFDNDGTLWNEKPTYIHFQAVFHTLGEQLKKDPSLKDRQPWAMVAKGKPDLSHYGQLLDIESFGLDSIVEQVLGVPYSGMTSSVFKKQNEQFLKTWKHPKYKVGYQGLTYQPMKELIDYLHQNQFKVFIFTADEVDFLRPLSQELYNIPPERVFGTSMKHDLTFENGVGVLTRTSQPEWINNWAHKSQLIQRTFGDNVPLIAVGNSNGDQQMLHYTASYGGLALWLHHDDEKREDKYDKHTDELQKLTQQGLITPINMSGEWKTVF
ncbi:HAD family hydrolase [Vibrio superstes]|uniref:Haloacid dehalogenase n=1 Tax=Vibrio superstes NBRC 103154 TaxID=1219062 RepID=A0A511QQ84_9VIBR|nr:HAD family hydrolase [Vibrio superstes]GEM79056.1 haloacid dehalogenase [Vibrio superstes NBRC 103154]